MQNFCHKINMLKGIFFFNNPIMNHGFSKSAEIVLSLQFSMSKIDRILSIIKIVSIYETNFFYKTRFKTNPKPLDGILSSFLNQFQTCLKHDATKSNYCITIFKQVWAGLGWQIFIYFFKKFLLQRHFKNHNPRG